MRRRAVTGALALHGALVPSLLAQMANLGVAVSRARSVQWLPLTLARAELTSLIRLPRASAVHLNFAPLVPPGGWTLIALPDRLLASLINYLPGDLGPNLRKMLAYARSMAYYYVHQQRPQQLAPAILDSPVGLLAWLSFFWGQHIGTSPTFTTDVMLTACTIYYFTECFGTSMLPYHNNVLLTEIHGGSAYRVQDGVTLGYSDFPNEIINMSRSWLTWSGDLRFYAKGR